MSYVNCFIVEGLMIKLEKQSVGTVLRIEYRDESFLDILFKGEIEKVINNNFKQFKKCRIVGRFIGSQGLFAEHITIEGVKDAE